MKKLIPLLGRFRFEIAPSDRPTMSSAAWRRWAIVCVLVGAIAGVLVARALDRLTVQVAFLGALLGFLIGMYIVETIWERRYAHRADDPPSPIGKRR